MVGKLEQLFFFSLVDKTFSNLNGFEYRVNLKSGSNSTTIVLC
jgi:hypothetical protein